MKRVKNKPNHITKGDIFDDLGFSQAEAATLKIKAAILSALLERVRQRQYTQAQLAALLHDHQPNISNLLNGKISKMSIEKLLSYANALHLEAEITMKTRPKSVRNRKSRVA